MLLMGKELKVIHVTTHVALRRVPDLVHARARGPRHPPGAADHDRPRRGRGRASRCAGSTRTRARTASSATRRRRRSSRPSRTRAREGLDVYGPLPADTLFSRARGGEFDIVVAMYHDQGHVPVKTLGFNYDETTRHLDGALRRQRHRRPARSCACRWTTAPPSTARGRASPTPRAWSRPSMSPSACSPPQALQPPDEDCHGRAALRELISRREGGPPEPPPLRPDDDRARPHRAAGRPDAGRRRRRRTRSPRRPPFTPTRRGGGGPLQTLWWQAPDPAQPALRHRHQGPGRLAHLLRAARRASIPTATWCPILAAEIPSVAQRRRSPRTARGSPGGSRRA